MQVYLAVTPAQVREALPYCRGLAHVAYRIGPGSALLRQSLLLQTRGGLLSVSDREAPCVEDPRRFCEAVVRECGRRGFTGVLLDFEAAPTPDRLAVAERLSEVLTAQRRTLYLPESCAGAAPGGICLIGTAVSGGSFTQRLEEAAAARGGARRLALDVERLRMDFTLPAPTGRGTPLTGEDLAALMERESPAVFFSPDLCARYFTYARDGQTHFVLFDDADTLSRKLQIGAGMGFSAAFFMYPEVRDLLPRLFPRGGG